MALAAATPTLSPPPARLMVQRCPRGSRQPEPELRALGRASSRSQGPQSLARPVRRGRWSSMCCSPAASAWTRVPESSLSQPHEHRTEWPWQVPSSRKSAPPRMPWGSSASLTTQRLVEGPAAGKLKRGTGAAVAARGSSVPPNRDVPVALFARIIARPQYLDGCRIQPGDLRHVNQYPAHVTRRRHHRRHGPAPAGSQGRCDGGGLPRRPERPCSWRSRRRRPRWYSVLASASPPALAMG